MKHMSLRSAFALMLSASLFFVSCQKGDTGPEGPQGEQGEQGEKGDKGDVGSANVIYSNWLDVTFAAVDSVTAGAEIEAPELVDSILQKGTMKVYWNIGSAASPVIVALPYMDYGNFFGATDLYINQFFTPGFITLFSNYNVGTTTATSGDKIRQYRYVLIPGGVNARSSIDWNDYAQVKQYLGLKD